MLQEIEAPLRLQQLMVAFRLYGLGIGIGIFTFLIEKVLEKIKPRLSAIKERLYVIDRGAPSAWE